MAVGGMDAPGKYVRRHMSSTVERALDAQSRSKQLVERVVLCRVHLVECERRQDRHSTTCVHEAAVMESWLYGLSRLLNEMQIARHDSSHEVDVGLSRDVYHVTCVEYNIFPRNSLHRSAPAPLDGALMQSIYTLYIRQADQQLYPPINSQQSSITLYLR